MTYRRAMDFLRYHGVVLESAKGLEPSVAEFVAGEPLKGSWWGHDRGSEIFEVTRKMRGSAAVLVCSLAGGKITFIHRSLWPFFARAARYFPKNALDQIEERHTSSGVHKRVEVPFPEWLPVEIIEAKKAIRMGQARQKIGQWLERYGVA